MFYLTNKEIAADLEFFSDHEKVIWEYLTGFHPDMRILGMQEVLNHRIQNKKIIGYIEQLYAQEPADSRRKDTILDILKKIHAGYPEHEPGDVNNLNHDDGSVVDWFRQLFED
jgi:hypothetical protein